MRSAPKSSMEARARSSGPTRRLSPLDADARDGRSSGSRLALLAEPAQGAFVVAQDGLQLAPALSVVVLRTHTAQ